MSYSGRQKDKGTLSSDKYFYNNRICCKCILLIPDAFLNDLPVKLVWVSDSLQLYVHVLDGNKVSGGESYLYIFHGC